MKKTIAITIAMFLCVAISMAVLNSVQQKRWTKPHSDDLSLTVNSPVKEVQQQYKEYKWDYIYNMPGSEVTKENWNVSDIELTEDLFDFDEAGYKACEMLDNALPEYNIADTVLYARLREVYGFKQGVEVYSFADGATLDGKSYLVRKCDIDIHTGKCVQAIAGNEAIYNAEKFGPHKKYKELTQQQTEEILEYAVEKCSIFGYSDFVSYRITETPGFKIAKYWVYIYTEKDELLRVSIMYTDTKIYFKSFCNEKMLGYGLDITKLPDAIPNEIIG